MKSRVILKIAQLWKTDLFEVEVMSDEWEFEVPEQGPGVPDPDWEVCKLDVVDDDLDQGLLSLDSGEDSSELRIKDDPVTLDTFGKKLNWKLFELCTGLEETLKIVTDKVDAVLKKPLKTKLVRQLENGDTIGHVQVPDHELDAI